MNKVLEPNDVKPSEILCIEIPLGDERMLLTNMYRSPNSDDEGNQSINNFFRKLPAVKDYQHIMVLGDFNRRDIDWELITASSSEDNKFIDAVRDSFLYQHIKVPTRGRGSQTLSLLDLVFTMSKDDIETIEVTNPLGKSDHALIKLVYRCSPAKQPSRKVPDFKKADFDQMKNDLSIDWDAFFDECNNDINKM